MHVRTVLLLAGGLSLAAAAGCVNVRAPREVRVGVGRPARTLDSSRVPDPATLAEARAELRKAYGYIQRLERQNGELARDKAACKRERDRYKKQRDRYKRRLEEYEDD